MTHLASQLRSKLEKAVTEARDIAEEGARAALETLAVHYHEPFGHMSADERRLRNRLRVHARQLGDRLDPKTGLQKIDHVVTECAYEQWHRMLFARFLAENQLLIEPELGVAISLEECEELAKEQGTDRWSLASHFAQAMLPQIFRPDDPLLQVTLATEHRLKLEELLDSLDPAVFTASDSLGWVYQFWQSKKKDEVNRSEKKIGADELPAVTQLFTEPYMVQFLIHNTLGAWHVGKSLAANPDLAKNAQSEGELRRAVALQGICWDYLRFVRDDDGQGTWRPAAGTFELWPRNAAQLKVLDPCCGSGHFLVALFHHLVPLRMVEESLSAREACDAVLRDNLFGLEIDERCTQIAAFALALAAWQYPDAGGYRGLPDLHIACSGLPVSVAKEEWKKLALDKHNLRIALDWMHDVFRDAPVLGSLISPAKSPAAKIVHWDELSGMLEQALTQEQNDTDHEMGVMAKGLAKAAQLLAGQYHLVITNVPYLIRGKQGDTLKTFCERHYKEAKNDLATVFLDRCLECCEKGGTTSIVLPQNWLFLTTYKKFREKLLHNDTWHFIARLGPHAFQTPMWDFNVQLLIISRGRPRYDTPFRQEGEGSPHLIRGLDVSAPRTAADKATQLVTAEIKQVEQSRQLYNPDARVTFEDLGESSWLAEIADYGKGSTTGDSPRFLLCFWEFPRIESKHVLWLNSPNSGAPWSGRSQICVEQLDSKVLTSQLGCWLRGQSVWGRPGVVVNKMRGLEPFLYVGEVFDDNICPICPKGPSAIPAVWAFIESGEYHKNIRAVDQALKVTAATLTKVPFDLDYWTEVAQGKYPNGLPKPYSDDPTQWIFHGHPIPSEHPIQVAVARLLGYRWPAEQDTEMELSDEASAWVKKCEELLPLADQDGVLCIPSVRGEEGAVDRLRAILAAAYGQEWSPARERQLLDATGTRTADLDDWLRNHFFEQHCKLFHHRPFIWHIWDGRKRDGFHALVNYHKLAEGDGKGRKLLETLTYSILGDWITRQKDGVNQGLGGAEDRLLAALELEKRFKAILEGEPPFDIFIRWKSIQMQPIGWEPDINDGVRLNIRPFMAPDLPTGEKGADLPGGKKGAGILRWKPNINWEKDRGKDVASSPWYHLFKGDRINSHHLTNAEKRAARASVGEKLGT